MGMFPKPTRKLRFPKRLREEELRLLTFSVGNNATNFYYKRGWTVWRLRTDIAAVLSIEARHVRVLVDGEEWKDGDEIEDETITVQIGDTLSNGANCMPAG